MKGRTIRIGTRDSELALWQAKKVQQSLQEFGHKTVLVPVKSTGDLVLDKPLYELGITGIFTKTLDVALLKGTIDMAVHSMKDVPTALPKGIVTGAVLKRANVHDILIHKNQEFLNKKGVIATGSLRRKAQWLYRYPKHTTVDLRGNVNSRLEKLKNNDWDGAIFAAAGLERINLKPANHLVLDWMIPAPAQGAMVVLTTENDSFCQEALKPLNHNNSQLTVHIEREFLRVLEGGCTAPIGAIATITGDTIKFEGSLNNLEGTKELRISRTTTLKNYTGLGKEWANELLAMGGREILKNIKRALNNTNV